MRQIYKNARILKDGQLQPLELSVRDGLIEAVEKQIEAGAEDEVIDVKNRILLPGLVDTHVHLREPGFEESETILTGTQAAAHGGFTTIFAMPNLRPFPSSPEVMRDYLKLIDDQAVVRVHPMATITVNEQGREPVDYKALKELGIEWFSDDGVGVGDDAVMAKAMDQAAPLGVIFSCHTEDMNYRKPGASVHDSEINRQKGWIGIPSECESEQLKRDLKLAAEKGMKYHGCHISAEQSVDALRQAKAQGADVSAEVTAHHLLLEDKDVENTLYKMNPPLRSHEDRMALIEGLEDGTLDFIANDHAPHTMEKKALPMDKAPFGIVSLETSFLMLYETFVKSGRWSLDQLVKWMSEKPAARFGLKKAGKLEPGYQADFFILDDEKSQVIDPEGFFSKGKNTPFAGEQVSATILATYVGGKKVYTDSSF